MENKDFHLKYARVDGFEDKGTDFSDSHVKVFIHKQVVKKTGDGEDDFVIEEKPQLVEEYDLHKRIQEEAKGTDLKSMLAQVLRTGDDTILNQKKGAAFFGDITKMPQDSIEAHNRIIRAEKLRSKLPEELRKLSTEDLLKMSSDDILKAYGVDVAKLKGEKKVEQPKVEQQNPPVSEEGGSK